MNILIPHNWLLEHLETKATPEQIQKYLSLSGPSVERIELKEGEPVYDIEVTTNRVDCMSVRGIAREAAVILSQAGIPSTLKQLSREENSATSVTTLALPIIEDPQNLSRRITCVILQGVERSETPKWMAHRLLQIDQNIHDSVIDITNYITHDLGHPCHAFDYDKVMELGGYIRVTEAQPNMPFVTLDGEKYQTVGGEIIFVNPDNIIIDFPAIKGTANTAIDAATKNVLLWIESLEPAKVRFGSMTHAIRTVAAQLNEKNVDPHLASEVLQKGIELYKSLCGATTASEIYDSFNRVESSATITVPFSIISQYLGLTIETQQICEILEALGCTVEINGEELEVSPPTFRSDLVIPADIVEEIARIYGYHSIPSVLMDTPIPVSKPEQTNFALEDQMKRFFATLGWQELFTYSLTSESIALQSGHTLSAHLKLQNPLTEDRVVLRRTLLPSLSEMLDQNNGSMQSVFELANVYHPRNSDLPEEVMMLGFVSDWTYREAIGSLEAFFRLLHIKSWEIEPNSLYAPLHISGSIRVNGIEIGNVGLLRNGRFAAELNWKSLLKVAKSYPMYQPLSKHPPVYEDFTFSIPEKTPIGKVLATIQNADELIRSVTLKNQYQDAISITVTYQSNDVALSSAIIEPIRKKLVSNVEAAHAASLKGTV